MNRKFSLGYLTVPGCPPPEMIYLAARAGYDYVSLRTIPMGLANEPDFGLAKNKKLLQQTKTAFAETGIKLHDIENARIYDGVDLKSYLPEIEIAAELGARGFLTQCWTTDRDFMIEAFSELCDFAKPLGLTANLEPVTWANVTNITEALDILQTANRENSALLVDTLHFSRSRCNLEDLEKVPKDFFKFMHLCDAPREIPDNKEELIFTAREGRLYLGEGGIDIASIISKIPEVVYVIELPNLERTKVIGNAEHAWRCLDTAKAYLKTMKAS
ncbi:MAG: sugar phosphate isomerase/epimerase [Desulfitobacterium hafniense]|nr:sugar phosphate isomerase/epimerase [Desulfitobacterium hafniense]